MRWFGFFSKIMQLPKGVLFVLILLLWGSYFAFYSNPAGVQFLYADF